MQAIGRWMVFLVLMVGSSGVAWGAGFTFPENMTRSAGRGGASIASIDTAGALYLNPGALSRTGFLSLTMDLNIVNQDLCFQRAPYRYSTGVGGENTVNFEEECNLETLFLAPMFFGAMRIADLPLVLAAGVYGPSANGRMRFREMSTDAPEPNFSNPTVTRTGGQSYLLTDMTTYVFYPSFAAAWTFEDIGLSLGATAQLVGSLIEYRLAVEGDGIALPGTPAEIAAGARSIEDPGFLSYTTLRVSGLGFTGILGALYEPTRSWAFGLSWRPRHRLTSSGSIDVH